MAKPFTVVAPTKCRTDMLCPQLYSSGGFLAGSLLVNRFPHVLLVDTHKAGTREKPAARLVGNRSVVHASHDIQWTVSFLFAGYKCLEWKHGSAEDVDLKWTRGQ